MRYFLWVALFSVAFIMSGYQNAFAEQSPPAINVDANPTDPSSTGYLVYCPCMGRFGNQVAHLLGAMVLAHDTGRILVLPPFINYRRGKTNFVPFEHYFSVAAIQTYVPAVTMQQFLADTNLWPLKKRQLVCHARELARGCAELEGNPHKTFWEHYGIEFKEAIAVTFDAENSASVTQALPITTYPVLALAGAPASFPVVANNRHVQRFLKWSDPIRDEGNAFIAKHLQRPYVAIHLRNGNDFQNACKFGVGQRQYMASPQCGLETGTTEVVNSQNIPTISQQMCLPSPNEVVRALAQANQQFMAYPAIFIGTDNDDYKTEITAAVSVDVQLVRGNSAMLDLYVFTQADMFIGNCISSFSSLAVRDRRGKGLPSVFFGFDSWDTNNAYLGPAIPFSKEQ
ncbi:MAG: peptide-O-fucosyltransferase [Gammaproteobacteria bacterium]|jgi:peptide-O-fucosyltransferase